MAVPILYEAVSSIKKILTGYGPQDRRRVESLVCAMCTPVRRAIVCNLVDRGVEETELYYKTNEVLVQQGLSRISEKSYKFHIETMERDRVINLREGLKFSVRVHLTEFPEYIKELFREFAEEEIREHLGHSMDALFEV